jgi:foldase protein PrsA
VLDAFGSYRDTLINGVANLQVLQADLSAGITTDDQLRALYEQLKETSATQACARHILVQAGSGGSDPTTGELIAPTEDEYVAALTEITEIGLRLDDGEDFAAVASEVSDDLASQPAGGDLGCAPQGSYAGAFDDAIWSQEIGVVGPPVRSEYGYHLVLVTERGTLTFEEMRDDLRVAVEAQASEALQSWLVEAARSASVTVDPGAGTWDAASGLVKPTGVDAAELDLEPEDPNNPSDDLKPTPSVTTSTIAVPLPTTTSTP